MTDEIDIVETADPVAAYKSAMSETTSTDLNDPVMLYRRAMGLSPEAEIPLDDPNLMVRRRAGL